MIEKIKTITYEVRSHGQETRIDGKGKVDFSSIMDAMHDLVYDPLFREKTDKGIIKRLILHFQDVLKCMKQIEKEKETKKELVKIALVGDYKKTIDNIGKVVNPYPRLRGVKQ